MSLFKEKLELKVEEAEFVAQSALGGLSPLTKWILGMAVAGILPGFFIAKTFSHQYWKNAYKNLEVTAKTPFVSPKDLNIGDAKVADYGDGTYAAYVEIDNTNTDLAIPVLNYAWQYYAADGEPLLALNSEAQKGETFILPSQKKYITVAKIKTAAPIARAEFKISQRPAWQKRINVEKVLISTSAAEATMQLVPPGLAVSGTVYNSSPYQLKEVRLQFLIFDQSGRLKAASQRTENDLKPFERRAFKQVWPNLYVESPKVEIYPETNVLNKNNLILQQTGTNASDLSRPQQNGF